MAHATAQKVGVFQGKNWAELCLRLLLFYSTTRSSQPGVAANRCVRSLRLVSEDEDDSIRSNSRPSR